MIQLFKSNNPATIFLMVLLAALLHLPHLSHPVAPTFSSSEIGGYYVSKYTQLLFANNPLVYEIVYLVLLLAQAIWWNVFLSNAKFLPQQNFFPSFIYIIYSAVLPDFNALTPQFFTAFILIWLLSKLNNIYRREQQYGTIFDLGFLVSVAGLLAAHQFLLFVFVLIGLALLRPTTLQEWLNFLLGVFVPLFLVGTWSYYHNNFMEFEWSMLENIKLQKTFSTPISFKYWVVIIVTLLMIASSYFLLSTRQLSRLVQIRKFFSVLFHLCWVTALMWFFSTDRSFAVFYILAIPLSFYFAYYLCVEKKNWKANLWIGIWVAAILFSQYYHSIN